MDHLISRADLPLLNVAFGYTLSPQFVQLLFRSYDRRGQESSPSQSSPPAAQSEEGGAGAEFKYLYRDIGVLTVATWCVTGQNAISFDLFVQSCISLKRMTEVFKKYDDDRDG